MLIGLKNNDWYNRNCSIFYRLSSFPYITLIVFKQWENSSIPIKKNANYRDNFIEHII